MKPYATIVQAVDRLGESELVQLTDRLGTGEVDNDRLTAALVSASVEIDSHIGTRYSIPVMIDPVPLTLVEACIDMAVYKLSRGAVILTDEVKSIYDRHVKWLQMVAAGKVSIGIPAPAEGDAGAESGDVVLFSAGQPSVFGRVAGGEE
jgi:phage gp36-like protein